MNTVLDFAHAKAAGRRISMVAAYDAWSAAIIARSNVDAILVGDSAAMVLHGHPTTLAATVHMMALHTAAVARLAGGKLVIADLPFLSHRKGVATAMRAVGALMTSGAQAVKLEGVDGHEDVIRHIVGSGVPVMGHLGLTPQSVHQLGGFRVQGKNADAAERLLSQARRLEELGCFSIVLECVPATLAKRITAEIPIPTIGIGAGADCDGQVLVLYDMLGITPGKRPRFSMDFLVGRGSVGEAIRAYAQAVRGGSFPAAEHAF